LECSQVKGRKKDKRAATLNELKICRSDSDAEIKRHFSKEKVLIRGIGAK
jgi:hypothetical protein